MQFLRNGPTWFESPVFKNAERRELEIRICRVEPEELELILMGSLVSDFKIEFEFDRVAGKNGGSGGGLARLGGEGGRGHTEGGAFCGGGFLGGI